ncbi:MAG: hypothetical protein WCX65_02315 [bacterium]
MMDKQVEQGNEAARVKDITDVEIFRAGTWTDSAGRTVTYGNTNDVGNSPAWNEPVIYRNHESNKTATIYFECAPYNLARFAAAGVTRNGTNLDVAAGGSITSPEIKPWDVSQWSSITFTASGGEATMYTRTSGDNGASWTSWVARASGADLTGISCGLNGNDIIQWKLENAAGTCLLSNVTINFTYNRETLPEYTEEWQGGTRIPTFAKSGEYFTLQRKMPADSENVTVSLLRDDGTAEPLASASAERTDIGLWRWSTQNIAAQPETAAHFVARFTDQNMNKALFDLYIGGAEDLTIATDRNVKSML